MIESASPEKGYQQLLELIEFAETKIRICLLMIEEDHG
jgi:hypothetical protein